MTARRPRKAKAAAAPERPPLELGAVCRRGVWWPGHVLANQRGWVRPNRFDAFNERNGVCVCDASKEPMEWRDAKVFMVDGRAMVLCQMHGHLRWLAQAIVDSGFGGAQGLVVAEAMGALWAAPCPPAGGTRLSEAGEELEGSPFGISPPGSDPPVNQVEVSA